MNVAWLSAQYVPYLCLDVVVYTRPSILRPMLSSEQTMNINVYFHQYIIVKLPFHDWLMWGGGEGEKMFLRGGKTLITEWPMGWVEMKGVKW